MEEEQPRFRKVEAKKSKMHPGGLKDWVENEKWVDVRRKNKKGKFEPCGRNDTSKGEKPVCVPINKAKNLTEKQIRNRKRQKARKEREPNPGKKPNTTKYTEQAGGKSNVSDNHNIRFVGSMIPLSELRPTQNNLPKFIKISGIEDEKVEDPNLDTSVPPFEIPESQDFLEDKRRNDIMNNLRKLNDKKSLISHINALHKALYDNVMKNPDNNHEGTRNAFMTLEINKGNKEWDEYYHGTVEYMINSMNDQIVKKGPIFLSSDSLDQESVKELEQLMLEALLAASSVKNIFIVNNWEYVYTKMLLVLLKDFNIY
jgi:hypothetical protein